MKKTKRFKVLAAVLAMVFSLQMSAFAAEETQLATIPVEQPSAWAAESIQWVSIYELAPKEMYANYTSNVTREELCTVSVSLYERLTGNVIDPVAKSPFSDADSPAILKACAINILTETGNFEPQKEVTRLEMITCIYNTLKAAQPDFNFTAAADLRYDDVDKIPEASLEVVKYSVSKGILKGRNDKVLDILSLCTRQELMVFVKNTYEFALYEANRDSKGAFWKVNDEDSTVYLLGSVHAADPSMYPLSKNILKAFGESDVLVVEADISKQEEAALYMAQKAIYMDGNTLDKNIPKELYDRLVKFLEPYGINEEACNKFKPWYAALLVQNLQLAQNSLSSSLGIDLFFLGKATGVKNILEIEGIKFQVDMFDSFSNELQVQFLSSTLSGEVTKQEEEMKTLKELMKYWSAGDTAKLEEVLNKDGSESDTEGAGEYKEFNEKMWESRDSNMAEKVKSYLADPEGKTYFVVVGAGHMLGKTGIIEQLEGKYEIEQIK